MQEHFSPIVINLNKEQVSNEILHMIPVSEKDVAVDAWWRVDPKSLEATLD